MQYTIEKPYKMVKILIEFHEQPIQNGWAWPPYDAYPIHFSKTPLFQKGPKNIIKVENFKFFVIISNHFIGLFNGILHVLLLFVYPEKLKELQC